MVWLFPIFKATVGRWEYQKFQGFVRGLVQRRIEVSVKSTNSVDNPRPIRVERLITPAYTHTVKRESFNNPQHRGGGGSLAAGVDEES